MKAGTIKVSILYPHQEGKQFDFDYYINKHVPMVTGLIGHAILGATIERGICGATADDSPPYISMGNIYFESLETFQNSFGAHADTIMADIPNYTNVAPVVQMSEVLV